MKEALAVLKDYPCAVVGEEIHIPAKNPWETMTDISHRLDAESLYSERIELVEPTLEDVFIKLSGRRLTEETQ